MRKPLLSLLLVFASSRALGNPPSEPSYSAEELVVLGDFRMADLGIEMGAA